MSADRNSNDWMVAPKGVAQELSERVARETAARRSSGAWSEAQEREVAQKPLLFARESFSTSPARLELLRALCRTFNVEFKPDVTPSHRKVIGPIIAVVKRAMMPFLRVLIGPSFLKQSEFNATVVKLLGELSNEKSRSS